MKARAQALARARTSCTVWQEPEVLLSPGRVLSGSAVMLKLVEKPVCSVLSTTDTTVPASAVWLSGEGGGGGGMRPGNRVAP